MQNKNTKGVILCFVVSAEKKYRREAYVIAKSKDIIPEGIAASTTEIVNWRSTRPTFEAMMNATAGKKASFMTDVKAIIALLLFKAEKSIDKPKVIMIRGIAPWPR